MLILKSKKIWKLPPPKPDLFLHELILWISIIRNYEIKSTFISKHFKNKRKCENCPHQRKWQQIFIEKRDFWDLKILRMKIWRIEIIWKTRIWKIIGKLGFRKLFFLKARMKKWKSDTWPKGGHAYVHKWERWWGITM